MTLNILILAAGMGTRMKSQKPKVMHEILGKPILEYMLDTADKLNPSRTILLTSPSQDMIRNRYKSEKIFSAIQKKQLGTGDAVKSAIELVEENADLMILAGDVPMISSETLFNLYETHKANKNKATLLSMILENPKGYGRILRRGNFASEIVEEKDASEEIKKIKEVNSGIYVFSSDILSRALPLLKNENAQKEYYLTDLIKIAAGFNEKCESLIIDDAYEVSGINDRKQLSDIEELMLSQRICHLQREGTTVRSPKTVYIESSVIIEPDCEICANVAIKGKTRIGRGSYIGEFSYIKDKIIREGSVIKHHTVMDE